MRSVSTTDCVGRRSLVRATFYVYTKIEVPMSDGQEGRIFDPGIIEESDEQLKEPDMYKVLLHNDDYTTMEFVVEVIRVVFRKSLLEATKIMLDVHRKGIGMVGTYTYDIATTKARRVMKLAKQREYPLRCTVEKA